MYRLAIVDDEKTIAEGIAQLFPWESIGFKADYYDNPLIAMKPYNLLFSLVLAGWFDLLVLRPPFPIPGNTRQYQAMPGNAY